MSASPSLIAKLSRRAFERCDAAAAFTDIAGMIHRTFCSPAMARLHREMIGWMSAAGMATRVDAAGNLIGRFDPANEPNKPALIVGSHLDTVPNAGRYDGPLGVMLGIALVEMLRETTMTLPFAIEVVGFSEEEGVRFGMPFIGSRAMIGDLDAAALSLTDANGVSVAAALEGFGCFPDVIASAKVFPSQVIGCIEPHIEQGPVLEQSNLPLAVVTAIAGQTRAAIRFIGMAGHAGTVPMNVRRDALAASAEWIVGVERIGNLNEGLVATVGVVEAIPGVGNVIPGEARMRLDVRHGDDAKRSAAVAQVRRLGQEIALRRNVAFEFSTTHEHAAAAMDRKLTTILEESASKTGTAPIRLVSGAGHDAAIMARRFPTAMLFIRCKGGVSHHPNESVAIDDVDAALAALWEFLCSPLAPREESERIMPP